jgi:hypothetical protein
MQSAVPHPFAHFAKGWETTHPNQPRLQARYFPRLPATLRR